MLVLPKLTLGSSSPGHGASAFASFTAEVPGPLAIGTDANLDHVRLPRRRISLHESCLRVRLGRMTTPFEDAVRRVHDEFADHREQAQLLVASMTFEEKLGCLDGDLDAWSGLAEMATGGYHQRTFPAAVVERLGIPGLQFSDGPRGCVVGEKTAFPVSMARGATWDPSLEERIGEAIGAELRNVGATYYGGVCVNLLRHPGWGRAQETYGEEPYLVGEMGSALTRGAQHHVMACVKHFALNSMENARFTVDISVDERALHEVYLPHFRRVIETGVASVMSAYNSVNGEWCGENATLLQSILRDEWGFDGFVTSDFIFGLRNAAKSVIAGLDIEMPFRQQRHAHLGAALADGSLTEHDIDRAVTNTVATLLRFAPTFEREAVPARVLSRAHRQLAREAATASMVLLRNEGAVLPLAKSSISSVAVVGSLAAVANLGDHGSSDVIVPDCVTFLDGIRAALDGTDVALTHADTDGEVARGADVAIVVVGFTHEDEGEYVDQAGTAPLLAELFPPRTPADDAAMAEVFGRMQKRGETRAFSPGGDRRTLALCPEDEELIAAVRAVNANVVVVLMSGSAVTMSSWINTVPAVIMSWYPGIEGGHALADLLFGDADFAGRLPFVIPTDETHLPHWDVEARTETYDLWHGHAKLRRDHREPAFAFGFGLSYGSCAIVSAKIIDDETVECRVANTSERNTSTIVQVYGGVPDSAFERIEQRLIGFARVDVLAGATTTEDVRIDCRLLDVRVNGGWLREDLPIVLSIGQYAYDSNGITVMTGAS